MKSVMGVLFGGGDVDDILERAAQPAWVWKKPSTAAANPYPFLEAPFVAPTWNMSTYRERYNSLRRQKHGRG